MLTVTLWAVVALTFYTSIRMHGLGTFVTLGVLGATIYSIPALIDRQLPFYMIVHQRSTLAATPSDVDLVVLLAWVALAMGVMLGGLLGKSDRRAPVPAPNERMMSVAVACAVLATLGIFYLQYVEDNPLFFLTPRGSQDTGAVSLLWRWTVLAGLVASSLSGSRKLLLFHVFILFILFLRGDRTMVAISAASLVVAAAYKDPRWYAFFTPLRAVGIGLAILMILLGKSIYITLKSGLSGEGWSNIVIPLERQFLNQFEPLLTFSHLSYVMRKNIHIAPGDFLESIVANVLLVPSWFGMSSNVYNETITRTLPFTVEFGVAGSYLAHGWTVGGTVGAVAFYFMLPMALRLCDVQFRRQDGALKVFWCCVGGVFAFYVQRNGLDNTLSFVRQVVITCIILAAIAVPIRAAMGATLRRAVAPRPAYAGPSNRHSHSSQER